MSLASLLEESEPELKMQAQALCHVVFGLSKDWYALLGCGTEGGQSILKAAAFWCIGSLIHRECALYLASAYDRSTSLAVGGFQACVWGVFTPATRP